MRELALRLVVGALVMISTTMTAAVAAPPTEAEITAALAFVAQQTGLPIPAERPRIVLRSPDQIDRLLSDHAAVRTTAIAAHDNGTIVLRASWDGRRLDDASFLVHEVAHFLRRARPWRCRDEGEAEAYGVQDAWLLARGSSLAAIGLVPRVLTAERRCDFRVYDRGPMVTASMPPLTINRTRAP